MQGRDGEPVVIAGSGGGRTNSGNEHPSAGSAKPGQPAKPIAPAGLGSGAGAIMNLLLEPGTGSAFPGLDGRPLPGSGSGSPGTAPGRPGPSPAASPLSAGSASAGWRLRVLLVEDHNPARRLMARLLESFGFQVRQAADGREALRSAEVDRPDVILMDLNMPVMDGYEATRRLKADTRLAGIPVVVLSADVSAGARDDAFAAGAADFLEKPVRVEEIEGYLRAFAEHLRADEGLHH